MTPVAGMAFRGSKARPVVVGGGGTAVLRPNGATDLSAGGELGPVWIPENGANLHVTLADNSDATLNSTRSGSSDFGEGEGPGLLRLDLTTFAFGASTINSVTIRVRASGNQIPSIMVRQRLAGVNSTHNTHSLTTTPTTYTGTARTTTPGGGAWDQAGIDALIVEIEPVTTFDGGQTIYLYEVYADVVYA